MQKNKFLFLALFIFCSCSQEKTESLLSKSKKSSHETPSLIRALASGENNQCLSDIFNVDTLKKEISDLEKEFENERVQGTWKHIDLSTLSSAQGNFLKNYGDKIGDLKNHDSISYDGCLDVPCIINRIYGNENSVAGYVHYLWFLKFGNMLSADNQLPNNPNDLSTIRYREAGRLNQKDIPLKDYLFNENELYGLWRLSHTLKAPFTTLTNLKEIQRFPRGEGFGYPYGDQTCGVAHNFGFIILSDDCLSTGQGLEKDEGFLYISMTHELGHMIDYDEGASVYGASYRSNQSDYLTLTGFQKSESRSEGRVTTIWIPDTEMKHIRAYAKQSPMENFAELVAYFRHEGDLSKIKLGPTLNEFASKNYFNENFYTSEAQTSKWIKSYTDKFSRDILELIFDCEDSPTKNECVAGRELQLERRITGAVKVSEADGCKIIVKDNSWRSRLQSEIRQKISNWGRYSSSRMFLGKLKVHHEILSDNKYAFESFVECLDHENQPHCYQETLKVKYSNVLDSLSFSTEETHELTDAYLSGNPFTDIREEALKFYRTSVRSQVHLLKQEVHASWRNCLVLPISDSESPKTGPFLISDGYMVSSLYNCLNDRFAGMVNSSQEALAKKGLEAPSRGEKEHIKQVIRGELLRLMSEKFYSETVAEKKTAEYFIKSENGQVRKLLLKHRHWVPRVRANDRVQRSCKDEALRIIGMNPLYHLKKDLFGEYIDRVACFNISSEL